MGWGFRKSVRLGKGVRLNISKRGVGLSVGGKGLRVGVNSRGVYTSTSIPGTGLYRRDYLTTRQTNSKKVKESPDSMVYASQQIPLPKELGAKSSIGCLWTTLSIILLIAQPALGIISIIIQLIVAYKASKRPEKQALEYFRQGNAALAKNDFKEALANFARVVELVPAAYSLYPIIGDLYRQQEELQQAAKYYQSYLEQVEDESIKFKLGATLAQAGQYQKAVQVLQGLREEFKEDLNVINCLASSFMGLRQYDQARQVLEKGPLLKRKMNEEMKVYRYLLGFCYKELGEKKKAINQLSKVYAEDVTYLDTEKLLRELGGLGG